MWKEIDKNKEYEVNEEGEVRHKVRCKILRPFITTNGYIRIRFGGITMQVHRVVAETYIDNPNNYLEVNHKDHNKLNNFKSNLEWCTRSENVKQSVKNGTASILNICGRKGEASFNSKLTESQVVIIKNKLTNKENITEIAKEFKVNRETIRQIYKGKSWKNV